MGNRVHLCGPYAYQLKMSPKRCDVWLDGRLHKFSGRPCGSDMKLYAFIHRKRLFYIGVTTQAIRTRLRLGWKKSHGYYGYRIRDLLRRAELWVWYLEGIRSKKKARLEAETIEAEVAFRVRAGGQWPEAQTEIHFHRSRLVHRRLAEEIVGSLKRLRRATRVVAKKP
jgi:hypothetical protein